MKHARNIFVTILSALVISLCVVPAWSAESPGEIEISLISSTLWSGMRDVEVSGDYAYCVFKFGLGIADVSDPAAPLLVGQVPLAGAWSVAYSDDYVYLTVAGEGLRVIEVSNRRSPVLIGSCGTQGSASGVAIEGNYAYIADGNAGLQILDISDPSAPTPVGICETPGTAVAVAVSSGYAYIADRSAGLQIIDLSEITAPVLVANYQTAGDALDVAVKGDCAAVAEFEEDGIVFLDVSVPTMPRFLGNHAKYGWLRNLDLVIDYPLAYCFFTDYYLGLGILDISDPMNPVEVGGYSDLEWTTQVDVQWYYAYVVDGTGLNVIDVSGPACELSGHFTSPHAIDQIAVSDEYVCAIGSDEGLYVVPVSDLGATIPTQEFVPLDLPADAVICGNYAYVRDYPGELIVFDLTAHGGPLAVSYYSAAEFFGEIAASGNYLLLADFDNGLKIVDVSDPTAPSSVGDCGTPGRAYGVAASGNRAYILDDTPALRIIDFSNASQPTLIGSFTTAHQALDIAVSGDYVYLVSGDWGLQLIDVSNPSEPELAGSYEMSGYTVSVAVSDDYAYVVERNSGLYVFDVSDPSAVSAIASYPTPWYGWQVALASEFIFLADRWGILILRLDKQTGVIEEVTDPLVMDFSLAQNYPNPFNPSTTIEFSLPEKAKVKVSIFNLLGRSVATLLDQTMSAGTHRVVWNGRDEMGGSVATGIYLCRVQTNGFVKSRKMVLIK